MKVKWQLNPNSTKKLTYRCISELPFRSFFRHSRISRMNGSKRRPTAKHEFRSGNVVSVAGATKIVVGLSSNPLLLPFSNWTTKNWSCAAIPRRGPTDSRTYSFHILLSRRQRNFVCEKKQKVMSISRDWEKASSLLHCCVARLQKACNKLSRRRFEQVYWRSHIIYLVVYTNFVVLKRLPLLRRRCYPFLNYKSFLNLVEFEYISKDVLIHHVSISDIFFNVVNKFVSFGYIKQCPGTSHMSRYIA